jgi:hypothetical protein
VAVQPDGMAVFNAPPELRGDDHLVPQRRERLAVLGRNGEDEGPGSSGAGAIAGCVNWRRVRYSAC